MRRTRNWNSLKDRRPVADSRERNVRQRLAFIEFVAYWEGSIIRSKIVRRFGISGERATKDLAAYRASAPDNLFYDQTAKRYLASPRMRCKFIEPNAEEYLRQAMESGVGEAQNDVWMGGVVRTEFIRIPKRPQNPEVLRGILRAIHMARSIELDYRSFDTVDDDDGWERVSPHAMATDGLHWFVRAYCHGRGCFRTLVLDHCCEIRDEAAPGLSAGFDEHWSRRFNVLLAAKPGLSERQRRFVERTYLMSQGKINVPVRIALLQAFEQSMMAGFPGAGPMAGLVAVANQEEYREALAQVSGGKAIGVASSCAACPGGGSRPSLQTVPPPRS